MVKMKLKEISIFVAGFVLVFLGYMYYKAKGKLGYRHCGANDNVWYCGNTIYCCRKKDYIMNEVRNTDPPIRLVWLICVDDKVDSESEDFDTQSSAIQFINNNFSRYCFQTAYTKPSRPYQPPLSKYPIRYPV